jgi:hypothetical protein
MSSSNPTKSTTTTNLPDWMRPQAENFLTGYAAQAFGIDPNTGLYIPKEADPGLQQQTAGFNPTQLAALQNLLQASGSARALSNTAIQQADQTMGGAYLSPESNPYLKGTYDAAARSMTDAYSTATAPSIMAAAQQAGQMGSSGMDESLAYSRYGLGENLGNLANNIYGGNYQQERQRQLQALQLSPQTAEGAYNAGNAQLGVGSLEQQQAQSELDTNYLNAVQRSEYPFQIFSGFGGALGQAAGGAGTSSTKASGSSNFWGK